MICPRSSGNFHIERQLPKSSENKIGDCEFVFNPEENYDYFVTLDGLTEPVECKVYKDHRLLFLGEPPYIKQYNQRFVKQYGYVFSCQKKMIQKGQTEKSLPLLPWMVGMGFQENSHKTKGDTPYMTYDDFRSFNDDSARLNRCCLITSNKKFTKGHRDRVHFTDYVIKHHSDIIDIYGNGYKSIPDKFDILRKYKYAIVIENCKYPDYWTEKIGDCFLASCYPIYHGCPNIEEFFPEGSFTEVNVRNITETIDKVRNILDSELFEESTEKLVESKNLVLDEYNIFPQIAKCIFEIEKENSNKDKSVMGDHELLYPMRLSFLDKVKQLIAWKLNLII